MKTVLLNMYSNRYDDISRQRNVRKIRLHKFLNLKGFVQKIQRLPMSNGDSKGQYIIINHICVIQDYTDRNSLNTLAELKHRAWDVQVESDHDTNKCDSMTTTWLRYASAEDFLARILTRARRVVRSAGASDHVDYLDRARGWSATPVTAHDAAATTFSSSPVRSAVRSSSPFLCAKKKSRGEHCRGHEHAHLPGRTWPAEPRNVSRRVQSCNAVYSIVRSLSHWSHDDTEATQRAGPTRFPRFPLREQLIVDDVISWHHMPSATMQEEDT